MVKIKQFEIVERCLFWKEKKILIVGDLHLGYEDSLTSQGVSIPRKQMEETYDIFKNIFSKSKKVKKIILMGDVKHNFGGILKQEREEFLNLVGFFKKYLLKNGEIIIVKGNHDNILKPIVDNYEDIVLKDYLIIEDTLFFHGDKFSLEKVKLDLFDKKIKTVVKGHFHPAVVLSDGSKKERYKCFLYGKFETPQAYPQGAKDTIIVPSFFPLIEGKNVLEKDAYIYGKEFLKSKIYAIAGDEIYEFKVKDLVNS